MRRNFAWILSGNVIYAGCQWGMLVVLAKAGSATMVGQFALALAVVTPVIAFCNLQLRYVLCTDAKRDATIPDYFAVRLSTTFVALLFILASALAASNTRPYLILILLLAAARSTESLSDVVYGAAQRAERMDRISVSLAVRGILQLAALGIAVRLTHSLPIAVACTVGVSIAVLVGYDVRTARSAVAHESDVYHSPFHMRWDGPTMMRLFWLGLPMGAVTGLCALIGNIPRYVISANLGEHQLGIFAALYYLTTAGSKVTGAMVDSSSPRLAGWYAAGNVAAFRSLLTRLVLIALAFAFAGLAAVLLAGSGILRVLYGPEYATHTSTLVWLMAAGVFGFAGSVMGESLTAMRCFHIQVPLRLPRLAAMYLLCLFLIPRRGLDGAAIAVFADGLLDILITGALVTARLRGPIVSQSDRPPVECASDVDTVRVGIVAESGLIGGWPYALAAAVRSVSSVRLSGVALCTPPLRHPSTLLRIYDWVDRMTERAAGRRALADGVLPDGVTLVTTRRCANGDLDLSTEVLSRLAEMHVDVWISLAADGPGIQIARATDATLWVFRVGEEGYSGIAPLLREIVEGKPITTLRLLAPGDQGLCAIAESVIAVKPRALRRNISLAAGHCAQMICGCLQEHRSDRHLGTCNKDQKVLPQRDPWPSTARVAGFLAHSAAAEAIWRTRRLSGHVGWRLAIRRQVGPVRSTDEWTDFRLVDPPRGFDQADPFLFEHCGRTFLFFEQMPSRGGAGVIACAEVSPDCSLGPPEVVLRETHHLSYPFLFEHDGDVFLLPESSAARRVVVYRALDFPRRWVEHSVLLEGIDAVDPTLVHHRDQWFLFVGVATPDGDTRTDLHLYHASSPFGPWRANLGNPVVSDVRRGRPAGRVFERDGCLIRPGQDCSLGYGKAVVLNRIEEMTVDSYREVPIDRIAVNGSQRFQGSHTWTSTERFEAMDVQLWFSRLDKHRSH